MHMYICLHAYKYIQYTGLLLCVDMFMMYYLPNVLMVYVFFITGDLKDCCSYVNMSYCEPSVFTVNVIWLLLLYSCFYHALQRCSFFLFPIFCGP